MPVPYAGRIRGEGDPMIRRLQLCYRIFVHLAGAGGAIRS